MAAGTVLLTIYLYPGQRWFYRKYLARHIDPLLTDERVRRLAPELYQNLAAYTLLFVVPQLLNVAVNRQWPSAVRSGFGRWWIGLPLTAIGMPLVYAIARAGAKDAAIQEEYPLPPSAAADAGDFVLWEISEGLYYTAWESFFRGFLEAPMEEAYGKDAAVWFQTALSTVAHLGKPAAETFGAIPGGIAFSWLARTTRSWIYPMLLHWELGILTDYFAARESGRNPFGVTAGERQPPPPKPEKAVKQKTARSRKKK